VSRRRVVRSASPGRSSDLGDEFTASLDVTRMSLAASRPNGAFPAMASTNPQGHYRKPPLELGARAEIVRARPRPAAADE
jgi:hypothetical protein